MRTPSAPLRRTSAAAAAAFGVLALAGCGQITDQITEEAGEKAVEKAIEANAGEDVDLDIDADGKGEVRIDTSDGSYVGGSELPDDFPSDIPLVGEVFYSTSASSSDGAGWTIGTTYGGSIDDGFAEAQAALEGAGLTLEGQVYGNYASFTNGAYAVILSVGEGADGTNLNYVVTLNGS